MAAYDKTEMLVLGPVFSQNKVTITENVGREVIPSPITRKGANFRENLVINIQILKTETGPGPS